MMDENKLFNFIQKCRHLKYKNKGIFAADNFPVKIPKNTFIILNASNSNTYGTHWLLLCNRNNVIYFADPLGYSLESYANVLKRVMLMTDKVIEVMKNNAMQLENSTLCGLYCIYIAHILFKNKILYFPYITDDEIIKFVKHMN